MCGLVIRHEKAEEVEQVSAVQRLQKRVEVCVVLEAVHDLHDVLALRQVEKTFRDTAKKSFVRTSDTTLLLDLRHELKL